jgi:ABC-type multidrug transport system fused ATPase/permease subunit
MPHVESAPAAGEARPEGRVSRLYQALWRHAGRDRRWLGVYAALLLGAQLVKLAIPYYTGAAVNDLQAGGAEALAAAGHDILMIFLACVGGWTLHVPGRVIERNVAARIRERYADWLAAGILHRPLPWHEAHHSGETIQRTTRASAALFGFAEHQFVYLQNAVSIIGPIAAIFLISAPTGVLALAGYGVIALVLARFDRVMVRLAAEQNRREARYVAALADALGNFSTVLALRLEGAARRTVGERLAAMSEPYRRSIVANEAKWCVIDLLNNGIRCGLAVLFAWLVWRESGSVLLGSAVMVFQYAQQAGGVVGSMATHWQDLMRFATDFAGAEGLGAPDAGPAALPANAADGGAEWRVLRVEELAFRHGRGTDGIAVDALELRRGRRVALVGDSGSGKSTLLRLLAGLYAPERGRARLDEAPLAAWRDLAGLATLVPQDPEVFEATLEQNLTMGRDVPREVVLRAAAIAELLPVIERLPQGFETPLGERGVNLSGGQKQRLALARAVLAAEGRPLLLLDEPTSSLDPATEARLYANLLGAFGEGCLVSSIHRLHLLPRFDEVVLMADGAIVDSGPVPEVLARQKQLRALVEAARQGEPALAA